MLLVTWLLFAMVMVQCHLGLSVPSKERAKDARSIPQPPDTNPPAEKSAKSGRAVPGWESKLSDARSARLPKDVHPGHHSGGGHSGPAWPSPSPATSKSSMTTRRGQPTPTLPSVDKDGTKAKGKGVKVDEVLPHEPDTRNKQSVRVPEKKDLEQVAGILNDEVIEEARMRMSGEVFKTFTYWKGTYIKDDKEPVDCELQVKEVEVVPSGGKQNATLTGVFKRTSDQEAFDVKGELLPDGEVDLNLLDAKRKSCDNRTMRGQVTWTEETGWSYDGNITGDATETFHLHPSDGPCSSCAQGGGFNWWLFIILAIILILGITFIIVNVT